MTTFVEQIKAEAKKAAMEQAESFHRATKDFADHPLLYIALVLSGLLSMFAGVAIGLGVQVSDGVVTAKGAAPNIFAAILYGASFPIFFEYALANWLKKYLMREPDNKTQMFTSGIMIVLTFVGTCVTAYSASDVIATAFGFFKSFQEIPVSVQKWIVYAIPTMLMLNVAAGEMYRQFSQEAVLLRAAAMKLREAQVSADMEVSLAQMDAKKKISIQAAQTYTEKAQAEAHGLGSARGAQKWNEDRQNYAVPTPQPTLQPAANAAPQTAVYASAVDDHIADLTVNPTDG